MRNKWVFRKINLHFFEVMKNGQVFVSNVCHFPSNHRLLFSREMENIRKYKEVRQQNFLNLDYQYSNGLGGFQVD